MSLVRTRPKTTPIIIPTDVVDLPQLPLTLKDLDPEGVAKYDEQMREYWLRLADAINSLAEKLDSEN